MSSCPTTLTNMKNVLLDDLERFRLMPGQPLPSACGRCHRPARFVGPPPQGLFVCGDCYRQLLLTATPNGRAAVEDAISRLVHPRYQHVEFPSFVPYTAHLGDVRDAVLAWAKAAATSNDCGSLYLYSEPGPHGPGNGNGKSMVQTAAFKYVSRRRVTFHFSEDAADADHWDFRQLNLGTCLFDLMRHVVDPYMKSFRTEEPAKLRYFDGLLFTKGIEAIPADELVVYHLGQVPVLFLDDVGAGVKTGTFAARLYEELFDARANNTLPMFITSNFSPDNLATRLGSRAVSRVLRNNCKVIEVRAADFHAARIRKGT